MLNAALWRGERTWSWDSHLQKVNLANSGARYGQHPKENQTKSLSTWAVCHKVATSILMNDWVIMKVLSRGGLSVQLQMLSETCFSISVVLNYALVFNWACTRRDYFTSYLHVPLLSGYPSPELYWPFFKFFSVTQTHFICMHIICPSASYLHTIVHVTPH